ncbi:hypothetical protein [Rhodopila sp.]
MRPMIACVFRLFVVQVEKFNGKRMHSGHEVPPRALGRAPVIRYRGTT